MMRARKPSGPLPRRQSAETYRSHSHPAMKNGAKPGMKAAAKPGMRPGGRPASARRPYAPLRHCLVVLTAFWLIALSSCGGGATGPGEPLARATPTPHAKPTPKPKPTATPASAAVDYESAPLPIRILVDAEMRGMTLDQKLGQMIQVETSYQADSPDVRNMVQNLYAGSMIIYGKNIVSAKQLTAYITAEQANATIPLFVSIDEEGGNVDRLGYQKIDPALPSAQWLGATGDPKIAYQAGAAAAKELTALGINVDLAPVVDVQEVANPIEGPRLYASDPATVDAYASQFYQGLADGGVIGCLKHWPGIGSLTLDPHATLATISFTRAQLNATEFAAFRGILPALAQQPGMIMVTHVLLPAIDPSLPSSLSPKVVGVLRNDLGYNGVIITDNLYMQAIAQHYNLGQATVMAVQAGDDLLAGAWDSQSMEWMISALKSAISAKQISVSRIDQSVRRILTLKALHGMVAASLVASGGNGHYSVPLRLNGSLTALDAADAPRSRSAA